MKKISFKLIVIAISLISFNAVLAQSPCDSSATLCEKNITSNYISDGQDYRALLLDDEIAEFNMILYGGTTYRFAACSGFSDGNLIFSVYDKERNLLFTNKEYSNSPYWDFKITNTLDCIIEANLDPNVAASGCAVLLVGFKQ